MNLRTLDPAVKTGRNPAIDAAKGIGMLMVVITHIYYGPAVQTYLYAIHMPLFFLLAGLLFRRERYASFADFLKHKFHSLICPYLFFYFAGWVIRVGMSFVSDGVAGVLSADTLKSFLQMFFAMGANHLANNPLWFVNCLFCVEILYYFLSKAKNWVNILICTLLVALGWFLKSEYFPIHPFRLPWFADVAPFALGFYAIGNLLSVRIFAALSFFREHRRGNLLSAAAAVVFALVLVPLAFWNGKISLGSGLYRNGFLLYAAGLVGTLAVLSAGNGLRKCPFLTHLGRNSFAIMGTHYVLRNVWNGIRVALGLGVYDNQRFLPSLLSFVLVLTGSLLCTAVYNRLRSRPKAEKTI